MYILNMNGLSDETLIKEYLAGNSEAFEILFNRYKNQLFAYLFRLSRDREEAEDLFQEIFIKVIDKLPLYREQNKFKAWLYTMACNAYLDRKKSFSAKRISAELSLDYSSEEGYSLGDTLAAGDDPERKILSGEEREGLERALESLSPEQREIILLKHYGGFSFREIAEKLGVPIGTALARFSRGLEKLRAALKTRQ